MRKFIALGAATLLLLASQLASAAPQYEDDDYDDWGFGSRGGKNPQQPKSTDSWRWGPPGGEDGNSFEVSC